MCERHSLTLKFLFIYMREEIAISSQFSENFGRTRVWFVPVTSWRRGGRCIPERRRARGGFRLNVPKMAGVKTSFCGFRFH